MGGVVTFILILGMHYKRSLFHQKYCNLLNFSLTNSNRRISYYSINSYTKSRLVGDRTLNFEFSFRIITMVLFLHLHLHTKPPQESKHH
jgi:hypothetical protein